MNINITDFNYNYHGPRECGGKTYGTYTLHNFDVYNEIIIDGASLCAIYQPAGSYDYNDYHYPRQELTLSDEGGSSPALVRLNHRDLEEIMDNEELEKLLPDIRQECPSIDTPEKARALYFILQTNTPDIREYLIPEIIGE